MSYQNGMDLTMLGSSILGHMTNDVPDVLVVT